jgi:hypothetical protein
MDPEWLGAVLDNRGGDCSERGVASRPRVLAVWWMVKTVRRVQASRDNEICLWSIDRAQSLLGIDDRVIWAFVKALHDGGIAEAEVVAIA